MSCRALLKLIFVQIFWRFSLIKFETFFSENLFRTMTDLVVSEGYAAAGYEYINVDDCWLEKNRGANNELVADRRRFPSGMRALSDYVRLIWTIIETNDWNYFQLSRFIAKDWNLESTKIMAISLALVIQAFSGILSKTHSNLHRGMLITLNSMDAIHFPLTWTLVSHDDLSGFEAFNDLF